MLDSSVASQRREKRRNACVKKSEGPNIRGELPPAGLGGALFVYGFQFFA